MIVSVTWQPDASPPETFAAELPVDVIQQMCDLIGTDAWVNSDAVMWIPCRTLPGQPMIKRLFRLARITHINPKDPS